MIAGCVVFILTLSLGGIVVGGDAWCGTLLSHHPLAALSDNGVHAAIGGLSWALVAALTKTLYPFDQALWQIALCLTLSSLIDIDHFIAARSLSLKDVQLLTSRPFLHNSSLLIAIFALSLGLSIICKLPKLNILSWIFFVAFFSHHTRDAARRGYWIPPFNSTPPVNYWVYILITITLPYIVKYGINITKDDKYYKNIINLEPDISIV